MEFLFAYIAGVLTLINPCVLPVLPIVIAGALNSGKWGPVAMAAGMSLSFVVFGVLVTAFGNLIGLTQDRLSQIGAYIMIFFGLVLLIPALSDRFERVTARFSAKADTQLNAVRTDGLAGQFIGGGLLGIVWSPCIGPTLGGAIALASQGEHLGYVTLIMICFALGVSTIIIGLGIGTRNAIAKRSNALRGIAAKSKKILGIVFIAVGLMLLFKWHHLIEAWLLNVMPYWLQDLSVAL